MARTKSQSVRNSAGGSRPSAKIMVENVNVPGYSHPVDAKMYGAMRKALLKALPSRSPGLTQSEMLKSLIPLLPTDLFPKGAKAGWWMKTVQLDLEAKGAVIREPSKPLRWRKTA